MGRVAGNLLIALSIILMAATVLWIIAGIAYFPRDPNEDQHIELIAACLFAGALFLLEVVLLLIGRYLRQPYREKPPERTGKPGRRRLLPLAVYLGGSIGIALFAAFFRGVPAVLGPLWFLIGQPFILAQLFFGGLLGVKLGPGVTAQAIIVATNLLYLPALFYPLYRVLTIDRVAEVICYQRMRTLLILFGSVHLLIGAAFAVLIRA